MVSLKKQKKKKNFNEKILLGIYIFIFSISKFLLFQKIKAFKMPFFHEISITNKKCICDLWSPMVILLFDLVMHLSHLYVPLSHTSVYTNPHKAVIPSVWWWQLRRSDTKDVLSQRHRGGKVRPAWRIRGQLSLTPRALWKIQEAAWHKSLRSEAAPPTTFNASPQLGSNESPTLLC